MAGAVIDCEQDHAGLARWWGGVLGWPVVSSPAGETVLAPSAGAPGVELVFGSAPEPKSGWNRIHFDLQAVDPPARVAQLEALGARRIELDVERPWFVLQDPQGNEFCVLRHWDGYDGRGSIAAITVQAREPLPLAQFWAQAVGGAVMVGSEHVTALDPGSGPLIQFVRSAAPKIVKNRIHLDVRPFAGDDPEAEAKRLLARGARPADVGQSGAEPWVVLADPEGNEFCVLDP
nr:VOC family protein [Kineosporia babensis]